MAEKISVKELTKLARVAFDDNRMDVSAVLYPRGVLCGPFAKRKRVGVRAGLENYSPVIEIRTGSAAESKWMLRVCLLAIAAENGSDLDLAREQGKL